MNLQVAATQCYVALAVAAAAAAARELMIRSNIIEES